MINEIYHEIFDSISPEKRNGTIDRDRWLDLDNGKFLLEIYIKDEENHNTSEVWIEKNDNWIPLVKKVDKVTLFILLPFVCMLGIVTFFVMKKKRF